MHEKNPSDENNNQKNHFIIILTGESTRCHIVIYGPAESQIEGLAFVLAMFVVNNIVFFILWDHKVD